MGHSPVDEWLSSFSNMTAKDWVALVVPTSPDEEVLNKRRKRGIEKIDYARGPQIL